jgi:vitamin B12 transporter
MQVNKPIASPLCVIAVAAAIFGTSSLPLSAPLSAQVQMLPEVVVTASRVPVPSAAVGSTITVIAGDDIDRKQKRSVAEILREVPGVAVNRLGGFGANTQIRIRGAEANQTLVLLDGIEIGDPANGSEFDSGNLLAHEIERIEVLRGPQTALWGSDAIGGVVNIVTRKGYGKPEISAGLEAGSHQTLRGTASYRSGSEDHHIAVHAVGYHSDGISAASERRGNGEQDGYRNRTAHLKAGISPFSFLDLNFVGRLTDSEIQTDNFVGGVGLVDADFRTSSIKRYYRGSANLSTFEGRWTHEAGFGFTNSHRVNLQNGAINSLFEGEKQKFDYQTSFLLSTPTFAGAEHSLTLAAEREGEKVISASSFSNVDRDIKTLGYVAEYRLDLLDSIHFSLAGRHDDAKFFDDSDTYRVTAAYEHSPWGTRLHTSYGEGVKNPTIFELFGFAANFAGNPNLSPETAEGWDAGIEQSLLGGNAILDVTYFVNEITDLIQGSGTTAVNLTGKSEIYGVEFAGTLALNDDLTLSGTYTWLVGQDATKSELVRRPKHIASGSAEYGFWWEDRPGSLNVGVDFNGERTDLEFDPAFNSAAVRLESYTLVKVVVRYEVQPGFEVFVRGENLLDRDYEEALTFGGPGRAAYAGVRAAF